MKKPKRCPFCRAKLHDIYGGHDMGETFDEDLRYCRYVICAECHAQGPVGKSFIGDVHAERKAIKLWNQRS
jgi:hypothetical protein